MFHGLDVLRARLESPCAPVCSKSSVGSAPARLLAALLRSLLPWQYASLGTQPLPRVLELAGSDAAHAFTLDRPGARRLRHGGRGGGAAHLAE